MASKNVWHAATAAVWQPGSGDGGTHDFDSWALVVCRGLDGAARGEAAAAAPAVAVVSAAVPPPVSVVLLQPPVPEAEAEVPALYVPQVVTPAAAAATVGAEAEAPVVSDVAEATAAVPPAAAASTESVAVTVTSRTPSPMPPAAKRLRSEAGSPVLVHQTLECPGSVLPTMPSGRKVRVVLSRDMPAEGVAYGCTGRPVEVVEGDDDGSEDVVVMDTVATEEAVERQAERAEAASTVTTEMLSAYDHCFHAHEGVVAATAKNELMLPDVEGGHLLVLLMPAQHEVVKMFWREVDAREREGCVCIPPHARVLIVTDMSAEELRRIVKDDNASFMRLLQSKRVTFRAPADANNKDAILNKCVVTLGRIASTLPASWNTTIIASDTEKLATLVWQLEERRRSVLLIEYPHEAGAKNVNVKSFVQRVQSRMSGKSR